MPHGAHLPNLPVVLKNVLLFGNAYRTAYITAHDAAFWTTFRTANISANQPSNRTTNKSSNIVTHTCPNPYSYRKAITVTRFEFYPACCRFSDPGTQPNFSKCQPFT